MLLALPLFVADMAMQPAHAAGMVQMDRQDCATCDAAEPVCKTVCNAPAILMENERLAVTENLVLAALPQRGAFAAGRVALPEPDPPKFY